MSQNTNLIFNIKCKEVQEKIRRKEPNLFPVCFLIKFLLIKFLGLVFKAGVASALLPAHCPAHGNAPRPRTPGSVRELLASWHLQQQASSQRWADTSFILSPVNHPWIRVWYAIERVLSGYAAANRIVDFEIENFRLYRCQSEFNKMLVLICR